MQPEDRVRVQHMLEAARTAIEFMDGLAEALDGAP
jgi:hypothetical protein